MARIIKAPDSVTLHRAFDPEKKRADYSFHSKTFPPFSKHYSKPVFDDRSNWTSSFTKCLLRKEINVKVSTMIKFAIKSEIMAFFTNDF